MRAPNHTKLRTVSTLGSALLCLSPRPRGESSSEVRGVRTALLRALDMIRNCVLFKNTHNAGSPAIKSQTKSVLKIVINYFPPQVLFFPPNALHR